jgi:hypothetical protein
VRSRLSIARVKQQASEEIENLIEFPAPVKVKNPAAVALGKLGGSKGGTMRAQRLSTDRKKEIAGLAAKARWAKEKAQ